ncbi:hypothetical protein HD806DRAFT_396084 [Xylariaceae sp. AK1471]|nr:hypothetical protein HD806DRAFT_396084 [Xylariaceae sp. AK1471]
MAASVLYNGTGISRLGDNDGDSDYGSDFSVGEEQLVDKLLENLVSGGSAAATPTPLNHHGQHHALPPVTTGDSSSSTGVAVSTGIAQGLPSDDEAAGTSRLEQSATSSDSIEYPDLSQALSSLEPETQPTQGSPSYAVETDSDTRSPLQRFRTFPRRPLTVSDMAAGAWCQLQHWYTLTRLPGGRKTKTAAMRGGSRVHQILEDQVHSAVQVKIASKEEAFALRLWNIVQGLRTLRDRGLTRELEVWGTFDGEILNGVIDQISYECPNPSYEEELKLANSNGSKQQSSITDYLGSNHKTVYIADVKTRGSAKLPTGTAMRPARVQLFLYHRLLSDMVSDKVDYSAIIERYGLNGAARFSDAFIAQIGDLHDEIFYDADSEVEEISPDVHSPDLIRYRSISQIIPLLKAELKETFPIGSASLSDLVAVQYRHRDDGHIINHNSFPNDPEALDIYMKDNLRWWRGEREPEGVSIEDAYKCGWCEFAETCQWRKDKEVEFLKKKKRGLKKEEGRDGDRPMSSGHNQGPPWP